MLLPESNKLLLGHVHRLPVFFQYRRYGWGRLQMLSGKGYCRVFFFNFLQCIFYIVHQLVGIGNTDMNGCINTYCSCRFAVRRSLQ